jgi:hypothetical protein
MSEFFKGKWFIEGNEEIVVSGNLTINDYDSSRLDLHEPLKTKEIESKRIFGILDNGKKVSLEYCSVMGENYTAYGLTQKIHSQNCFIGEHFKSDEEVIIAMRLKTWYFDDWANIFPVTTKKYESCYKLSYKYPPSIKAKLSDFNIELSFGFSTEYPDSSSFLITQDQALYVEFNKKVTADKARQVAFKINQLMTILIGKKTEINNLRFYLKKLDKPYRQTKYHVSIYEPGVEPFGSLWKTKKLKSDITDHQMVCPFRKVKKSFPKILKSWFKKETKIATLSSLFTSVFLLENQFPETKFLTLAQALEAFHRQNRKNFVLNKKEYERKKKKIIQSLPDEYKEEFRGRLEHGNEPTFKNRFKDLLEETKDISEYNEKKINSISNIIRDLRNYYTHNDKTKKKEKFNLNNVIKYSSIMEALVKTILYKELGFKTDEIKNLFKHKIKFDPN